MSSNLLKTSLFPLKIAPRQAAATLILNIATFSIDLWLVFLLLSTLQSEFQQYSTNYKSSLWVLLAVITKFLFSLLQIRVDLLGKKTLFEKFSLQLSQVNSKSRSSEGLLNRLISRDILTLTEQLFTLIDPFQIIAESFLLIIAAYVISGFAGVLGLLGVSALIPISIIIGKLTHYYTEKLFKSSEERIDMSVKWLLYRKQIYLMQEHKIILSHIRKKFKEEINFRNIDSLLRSLEQYLVVFTRPIPMLFAFMLAFIKFDVQQNVLEIFWLSIPAIQLTLRAGRTFGTLKTCRECIENIERYIRHDNNSKTSKTLESDNEVVICDAQWQVWDGTLEDNICDRGKIPTLLKDLRLEEELTSEEGELSKHFAIKHFGKNISQGQLTRILFARSINYLIEHHKGTLHLILSLSSLDRDSLIRVDKIINQLPACYKIQLSDENKVLLASALEVHNNKTLNQENKLEKKNLIREKAKKKPLERSLFAALFSLLGFSSLLFYLPGFILGWFGKKTAEIPPNFATSFLWIFVIFIGIISATFAGWMVENKIRTRTLESYMKLITREGIEDETDLKQRIISDTSIMLERISWYVHDLSWMFCVLFIAIAGLLLTAFKQSCMVVAVYLLLALITWFCFSKLIRDSRKSFIYALNSALYTIENLLCFIGVSPLLAIQKKRQYSDTAFRNLYTSMKKLIWFKSLFAQIFVFFAGLLLVGVYGMYEYGNIEKSNFLFLMSLMLTIESQASNLVLALSGFHSQQNSLDRITEYDNYPKLNQFSSVISEITGTFIIPKRKSLDALSNNESMNIPKGEVMSIVGQSGAGKSTFLKLLSGLESNNKSYQTKSLQRVSCLYLDRDSINIFLWLDLIEENNGFSPEFLLSFLTKKISLNKNMFIVLDEILTVWSLSESKNFCLQLAEYVTDLCATIVVVDHRFSLNYHIHINEFLSWK